MLEANLHNPNTNILFLCGAYWLFITLNKMLVSAVNFFLMLTVKKYLDILCIDHPEFGNGLPIILIMFFIGNYFINP